MRIFIVGGKSGSGKGEVAKLIKEYYIYKIEESVITSFSKYLKMYATELTDWDGNPSTKPRGYLQTLGDTVRGYDNNFLINRIKEDINIYSKFVNNVIISDARMPEEIDEIAVSFDNVYSIYVDNQFRASTLSLTEQMHKTETALEEYTDFDLYISNDSDINSLKSKVFKFLDGVENDNK